MQGAGDEQLREGGDGNRSSLAFIQLEKQNDRLKDALVRLRDLTHETEAENKHRIADLEKELDLTSDLQGASVWYLGALTWTENKYLPTTQSSLTTSSSSSSAPRGRSRTSSSSSTTRSVPRTCSSSSRSGT